MLSANRLRPNVNTAPISIRGKKISQLAINVLQLSGEISFLMIKTKNFYKEILVYCISYYTLIR
jgi:hypothetical protein